MMFGGVWGEAGSEESDAGVDGESACFDAKAGGGEECDGREAGLVVALVACGIDGDEVEALGAVECGVAFDGEDVAFEEEVGGDVLGEDVDGGAGGEEVVLLVWVVAVAAGGVDFEGARSFGECEEDDGW